MAATLISAVPAFVSPEEHRNIVGSTPVSFTDIPPVLRHKEEPVSVTFEPTLDGFSEEDAKEGVLYVLESVLVFMSKTGKGFQIEYPSITLHAVSRGDTPPSIYCQLDESFAKTMSMLVDSEQPKTNGHINETADENTEEDEDEGEENEEPEDMDMRVLNIIPSRVESLDPIFEALSLCAALHPDPPGSDDEDEGLDDAFIDAPDGTFEQFTGTEEEELSEVGRAALAHLESIIYDPFEKKEGSEESENTSKNENVADTKDAKDDKEA
ncbi:regulator of volume decrease after cellular swelling-domain-containing protein [Lentinula raphanica]|uniref:Regulator of volume decrease after cellular swelling-domain-containing protein n=1 Tax=Lentinula raphanica TaxID=153919 RepID=A0AA38UEL2_9AGAR|nr:regulator of volume decrease after cellular swelling-domain-containing protein [Lentinula raphanica]KAJ3838456.1 regulator of volume decrease after cellular swelling-domain-containing protein [Lentinula raphanica]